MAILNLSMSAGSLMNVGFEKVWLLQTDLNKATSDVISVYVYQQGIENAVSEQEGLWIKNGGPTDDEWEAYKQKLTDTCGMDELLKVYQDAYDRYSTIDK